MEKLYTFKNLVLFAFLLFFANAASGQNSFNSGDGWGNGWGIGLTMSASAGGSLIHTTTNSLGGSPTNRSFRFFGTGTPCGQYEPSGGGDLQLIPSQTYTSTNMQCGGTRAFLVSVSNMTDNWVFKSISPTGQQITVFRVQGLVRTVSSVSQLPTSGYVQPGQAVAVTANLNGALSTGQGVYMRYSNNNFTASTVVQLTGSGTTYTGNIPGAINTSAALLNYYIFTSTDAGVGAVNTQVRADGSNTDFYTINLNNNANSNYSYTVTAAATVYLHNFGTTALTTRPYTVAPGTFNANLNTSSWTNSSVTNWSDLAGNGGLPSRSLSTSTGNNTYTLTFNVASGYQLSVSSFNFWRQRNTTGPTNWSMAINGTSVGSGTTPETGASLGSTNVSAPIANLAGTITVVMTLTGSSGSGTFSLDDFTLNGTVSLISTTPPSITSFSVASPGSGSSGYLGNVVTVSGSGLTGVGILRLGGSAGTTVSSFTVVNDTTITFPALNASGTIYVESASGNATSSTSYTNLGYITTAAGTWQTAATWLGGAVPPNTNATTVTINHNVTGTTGTINVGSLTVNPSFTLTNTAGATLNVNTASTNSGTITTVGTFGVAATYTNSGTFTVGNGGTFQLNTGGFFTGTAIAYDATASTLVFNTSNQYDVANTNPYWPSTAGPFNVSIIQGGMRLNSGANRTVVGTLQTASGVFLTSAVLTLNGTVRIITDGFFNDSPTYGSASTLIYNNGLDYNRGNEWNSTSGAGYPANVQISNPNAVTTLNMLNSTAQCSGNLTIDPNTVLNTTSSSLTVLGNVLNNGTMALNGDVNARGNWTLAASATQTNNNRAVFFNTGTGNQTITRTGGGNVFFDYLVVDKAAGNVVLSSSPATSVTINTTTGNPLQILNAGNLDLNGQTLTFNNTGGNIAVNATGRNITSTTAGGTLAIAGNKTVTGAGTLVTDANVIILATAGMDFGSNRTTVNGTFQINGGGFAANNAPIYGNTSTLIYNGVSNYGVGNEWTGNAATAGQGTPQNVILRNSVVNMPNAARSVVGNLTLETTSTLNVNSALTLRGDLSVDVNAQLTRSAPSGTFEFSAIGDGLTDATTQTINIVPSTGANINFNIKSGAYAKLINQNFQLASGSQLTIESGGTFDFGFSPANVALNVTGTSFAANAGSTVKITSPAGIVTSGSTGNVQTTTRTFATTTPFANYHYIGAANQDTGTALPASVGILIVANTGTAPANEVALTNDITAAEARVNTGILNLNEKTTTGTLLNIAQNATLKIVGTHTFPTFTSRTINTNSTVEYGGANQVIAALTAPTYGTLKISGTGTKTLNTNEVQVGNTLEVTASTLSIELNKTLTVQNAITTLDDAISVQNGGSLRQVANVNNASGNLNIGKIAVTRITQPMYRFDYTYWSSPVANYTLKQLSTDTPNNRFFQWNAGAGTWGMLLGGTVPMSPGRGYIVRAPNNFGTDPTLAASYQNFTGIFSGIPNNGTVEIPVNGATTGPNIWNLIGNPYPSAISASAFLDANVGGSHNLLGGTLYFWTHNSPFSVTTSAYSTADYASWNTTGTAATAQDAVSNNFTQPTGKIAAGQGFFVQGSANGNAVFNNSMRILGDNMEFFRPSPAGTLNNANVTAKHRVWLNLQGATQGFSQTLVGYISNATNSFDTRFDGPSFGGNSVTFYSINETKNLVIQGRALPFSNLDQVPLGYKTTQTGNLIISIDHVDGLMENQDIYLKDNVLNIVHDLNASPYTFAAVPGTFNDRFVLRYVPDAVLDNPTFNDQINSVVIRKNDGTLRISSPYETIAEVKVYDISGRLVFEKKDCNSNTFEASSLVNSEQVLIVKVILNNGGVVNKKVF